MKFDLFNEKEKKKTYLCIQCVYFNLSLLNYFSDVHYAD